MILWCWIHDTLRKFSFFDLPKLNHLRNRLFLNIFFLKKKEPKKMKGGRSKETGAIVEGIGLFFGFYDLGLGGEEGRGKGTRWMRVVG